MKKNLLALILALCCILLMFAGCGQTGSASQPGSAKEPAADAPQTGTDAPETQEPESDPSEFTFPLTEDGETYTWFQQTNESISTVISEMSENWVLKELESLTGVSFEYITPPQDSAGSQYMILMSSNDYPDVTIGFSSYYTAGGYDSAIDDGIIADMTELAPELMPNYYAFLQENELVAKQSYTDTGKLWGVSRVIIDQPPSFGPMIRADWLEEQALDMPETLADWENVLTAFAANYDSTKGPLYISNTGYLGFFGNDYTVLSAFDCGASGTIVGSPFINKDGTAVYTPVTDGYKEYLKLMSDWNAKGLIYKDFASANFMEQQEYITQGEIGIFVAAYNGIENLNSMLGVENAVRAIKNPVKEDGQTLHLYMKDAEVNNGNSACIGGDVDNIEVLLKYLDYWWTDEGRTLVTYGIEGKTFEYVNGKPQYTEMMYANEDAAVTFSRAMDAYTFRMGPIWYDWSCEYNVPTMPETSKECNDMWACYDADYMWPSVTLTADETSESASMLGELNTYVSEYTLKAIAGEVDVEETWDDYIKTLESLGSGQVLKIYQDALDRYLAR